MIKLQNVEGVSSINLDQVYPRDDETKIERLGLFFGAPWSLPSIRWAELVGALTSELNGLQGSNNFLQIYVVPPELNENDKEGYDELEKKIGGKKIKLEDKVLVEQILKEFTIREFPQLYIFNDKGDIISKNGIEDIISNDVDKIRKLWEKTQA